MAFSEGRKTTIQKKLVLIIVGIIFSTLLLANIVHAVTSYAALRSDVRKQLQMTANVTTQNLQNLLSAPDFDPQAAAQKLRAMVYQASIGRACLYDVRGVLQASYIKAEKSSGFLHGDEIRTCPADEASSDDESFWHGEHLFMPIAQAGQIEGYLFLDYHLDAAHKAFFRDRVYSLVIMVLAMLLAYLAAMVAQRYISRPIVYLAKIAAALGETGDLSIRAQSYSNDETGVLVYAFNCMMDGLENREKALLQARKEANKANELKGQFLATMSHEIRTPMTGILGMADLLHSSDLDKRQKGYVQTIINSAESLLDIINDILDFSKIEAGKLELEYMPVDLFELIDEIGMLYSVQAREKAVELVVHYHPGTEQFIFTDPVRLRQIISNLLNNAIKFTVQGHIVLSIEEDKNFGSSPDKTRLIFKVKDTGVGMALSAQEKIFTKFSQADASTTRRFGGTGLGLAICKNLLDMMGGDISVESRIGQGSTFTVSASFARNTVMTYRPPMALPLTDVKILVVDDLPVNLQLIREILEAVGAACDVVVDGAAALQKMEQAYDDGAPYQMAVVDYLMPEMNGEMLACAIKDNPNISDCCLVMLTAAGNPIAPQSYVDKGFSAHIAKPVQQESFVEAMAYVWSKYQEGHRHELIRYEGQDLRSGEADDAPKLRGIKILMAEDNLVNQAFIQEILLEMECDLLIVQNGKEAVTAAQDQSFDLIFMDCLMPVMDGFEATEEICRLKKEGSIDKKLPIIALTANAMKGDRNKCLATGMDDYLSKPVRRKELKAMVYKWVEKTGKSVSQAQGETHAPQYQGRDDGVDINGDVGTDTGTNADLVILDHEAVANARDILKERYDAMVDVYLQGSAEKVNEIKVALKNRDIQALIRPAHTLKSTSLQMGAIRLSDVAMKIEKAAKLQVSEDTPKEGGAKANDDVLNALIPQLQNLLDDTKNALEEIRD